MRGYFLRTDKVWSKTENLERDIHGDPLIQKYATMNEVVTVTAGIKRINSADGGCTTVYSGKSIKNLHNHH